jgi:hypothetical protein
MALDMGWAVSLSIAGIIATIGVLSIINIIVKRSERKGKRLTNFV